LKATTLPTVDPARSDSYHQTLPTNLLETLFKPPTPPPPVSPPATSSSRWVTAVFPSLPLARAFAHLELRIFSSFPHRPLRVYIYFFRRVLLHSAKHSLGASSQIASCPPPWTAKLTLPLHPTFRFALILSPLSCFLSFFLAR